MKLAELVRQLSLDVHAGARKLDTEVSGGYAADLLSCVMAKAQAGNVWVTLQGHANIVAVANLLGLAGIIVTEGITPDSSTLAKAEEQGVPILTTPFTAFTVVSKLAALGVRGVDER